MSKLFDDYVEETKKAMGSTYYFPTRNKIVSMIQKTKEEKALENELDDRLLISIVIMQTNNGMSLEEIIEAYRLTYASKISLIDEYDDTDYEPKIIKQRQNLTYDVVEELLRIANETATELIETKSNKVPLPKAETKKVETQLRRRFKDEERKIRLIEAVYRLTKSNEEFTYGDLKLLVDDDATELEYEATKKVGNQPSITSTK